MEVFMRKKIMSICLLGVLILFTGCSSYKGFYRIDLQKVKNTKVVKDRKIKPKINNLNKNGRVRSFYEDELMKIMWLYQGKKFKFIIKNKTTESIKIFWDELVYVNKKGACSGVIHSGVKYIDKNRSQLSSTIIQNSYIDDVLVPKGNVFFSDKWYAISMLVDSYDNKEKLIKYGKSNVGKTIKLFFPLLIKGKIHEYIFSFKVKGFIVQ